MTMKREEYETLQTQVFLMASDFERCEDDNCPCPGRVLKHADGSREGHVAPCRYCDQSYRRAQTSGMTTVHISEAVDRMHEGVDALARIWTRGL